MTTLVSAPVQGTSSNRFTHLLATRPWLLADGATGSNLFDVGLMSGDAPELWNTEHPERITKLHQDFVDAEQIDIAAHRLPADGQRARQPGLV